MIPGDFRFPAHWPRHDMTHDTQSCTRCQDESEWTEDHEDCPCLDQDWTREDVGSPAVPEWVWVCDECLRVAGPAWVGGAQ